MPNSVIEREDPVMGKASQPRLAFKAILQGRAAAGWGVVLVLALASLAPLAAPAGAVVPGENGRIVFASGRDGGDALAKLFLLPVPSSTGGGTVSPAFTPLFGGQYRHPTWSPDRTKVAYANGTPGSPTTELFDIAIHDLEANTVIPITNTGDGLSADRPAWSPDGSRIAYEHEPTVGSAERDIRVQTLGGGAPLNLTTGGPIESNAAWSPDSRRVYYGSGDPSVNANIVSEPADNSGTPAPAIPDSGISEFQPSISPDGAKICFTIGTGFNNTADVMVSDLSSPSPINLSDNNPAGDYDCTWSPDGQLVAYVSGISSAGALLMERADDTSPSPITLTDSPGRFDGNPDWAPDGRPLCPDSTVTTMVNKPVTITIDCADTGPPYERTPVKESIANDGSPTSGTVGAVTFGDPSTVLYTPNRDFTGTDTVKSIGFDDLGFGNDRGTVTINVRPAGGGGGGGGAAPRCGGKRATIVGTGRGETLTGTGGTDVIVGLGGKDTIRAGRGNDVVCAGPGSDRIDGGRGNDRLGGGGGNDRLGGQSGHDRLSGNAGADRLNGGPGRDRLSGGSGRDRLNGGPRRDACIGGGGRDRAAGCERRSSI